MARMVADEWPCALADMDSITTNLNERLMVVYAGVGGGETNFLVRISQMADFVLSNKVSLAELRFYKTQCGLFDHHATSSLIRRYQEPAISNLIMKLYAAGAYPQGVSDIFSGEAKESYLDAVHALRADHGSRTGSGFLHNGLQRCERSFRNRCSTAAGSL